MARDWDQAEIDAIVDDLLAKADPGFDQSGERERGLDGADEETPSYLWEPYIRRGHLNLLDGLRGTGKTTLLLMTAMQGATGYNPFTGEQIEKFKTGIITVEDTPGELKTALKILGFTGEELKSLHVKDKPGLELNDSGLKWLTNYVIDNNLSWLVLDPARQFLPAEIRNEFDNINISKWLGSMKEFARREKIAVTLIRHFKKDRKGIAFTDMGAGGESWPSACRTHLVLLKHPDADEHPRYTAVFPARGHVLGSGGQPFAFEIWDGRFTWITPERFDIEPFAEKLGIEIVKRGSRGPAPSAVQKAANALTTILANGPVYYKDARQRCMDEADVSQVTVYRAKTALELIDNGGYWSLPSSAKAPHWAGLDDGYDPMEDR